eukprot:8941865-Alexandrium_andersonii.AAC.1
MSASLVGSEMCIRDSPPLRPVWRPPCRGRPPPPPCFACCLLLRVPRSSPRSSLRASLVASI